MNPRWSNQSKPRRIPVRDAGKDEAMDQETREDHENNESIEAERIESDEQVSAENVERDATRGELESEIADLKDKWMRAVADLDNYRKRAARDADMRIARERERILLAWLDVADNMERALDVEGAAQNLWFDGVEAVHQQMLGVLKSFGCEPFDSKGEAFDPNKHEAVATASLPDQPEGVIVDVAQVGYTLGDRVLRPAKVIPVKHA